MVARAAIPTLLALLALGVDGLGQAAAQPPTQADGQTEERTGEQTGEKPGAQTGEKPGANPWEEVTAEEMAKARSLFEAGKEQLVQKNIVAALVLLQSSLDIWDHPRTRYLAGLAHLLIDEPVEAYEHFRAAVRYGPEPFRKPGVYDEALAHIAELENIVAEVVVTTAEPDAVVTMDGEELVFEDGHSQVWARVGEHRVVAILGGKALSRTITVLPHTLNQLDIPAFPVDMIRVRERPITEQSWKPWALAGLGAGVTLLGAPLQWRASVNLREFDDQVAACHAQPGGCSATEERALLPLYNRGRVQNRVAIASFAIGGTLMAAGLTLVILNLPETREVPRPIPGDGPRDVPRLAITPSVGPGHAMVVGQLRF